MSIKNFSLQGVASVVEFGKRGLQLVSNTSSEYLSFKSNDGNTFVEVRGANAAVNDAFMTKAQLDGITSGIVQFVSTEISYNSGTVTLFETPANSMIYNVVVDVDSAWTGANDTTGISIGDSADPDRLFTDSHVDLSEAYQYQSEYQHVYSNATNISAIVTAGSASAGSARVTVSVVMDQIDVLPISLPEAPSYINQGSVTTGSEPTIDSVTSPSSVNEGSTANISVSTSNIPNNTTLSWSLTRSDDFTVSTGSFVVTGDTGSFSVTPTEDSITEGSETFRLIISGSVDGVGVSATSNVITINDTSTDPGRDIESGIISSQTEWTNSNTQLVFTKDMSSETVTTLSAVAFDISGDLILIGSYSDDEAATNAGKIFVLDRDSGNILYEHTHPESTVSGAFGRSGALSGNLAVVGASDAVYLMNVETGNVIHTISPPSGLTVGAFTTAPYPGAVDISDNYFITSYRGNSAFVYSVITGSLEREITPPNTEPNIVTATRITDTYIAIAHSPNTSGASNVHVYSRETGNLLNSFYSSKGIMSIDISGDYLVFGVPYIDSGARVDGRAFIVDLSEETPIARSLSNPFPQNNDNFGISVAVSGGYAFIGCHGDSSENGTVRIYDASTRALIKSTGVFPTSQFGDVVAASGNYFIGAQTNRKVSSFNNQG